jgi:hypothetical protein
MTYREAARRVRRSEDKILVIMKNGKIYRPHSGGYWARNPIPKILPGVIMIETRNYKQMFLTPADILTIRPLCQ